MVEQNQQQTAGGNRRPNHIPIGEDHLQFKNDQQIMDQLAERGKPFIVFPFSFSVSFTHPQTNPSLNLSACARH